jgi:3-methyladenine DNA glycosylase/8-oxoguanine DNA glycosylase
MPSRTVTPRFPVDLRLTLAPLRRGRGDPCTTIGDGEVWRATRTPEGPATTHLRQSGDRVVAEAWGPGAGWALENVPALVGDGDDPTGFRPQHRRLRDLHQRMPGLRIPRTNGVLEVLVPVVLEQKVTGFEARRAWRLLVAAEGEPAPGPGGLRLPPTADRLAGLPYYDLHRFGVERRRADTIKRVAARAARLDALPSLPLAEAYERLTSLPGVGLWTAAEVGRIALGDADAVSVGDSDLPTVVALALAGEERGDDSRMLELLEPYRGHRGRVIRLLQAGGVRVPRKGTRRRPHAIADR